LAVAEQRIDLRGWLVTEIEADLMFSEARCRLSLFRTATTWSLLQMVHRTNWDENGQPVGGSLRAWVDTFDSLEALRAEIERSYRGTSWRELVRVGASSPNHDPDLMRLWSPVKVDLELEQSSVHVREFGARGQRRQQAGWQVEALAHAVLRLEEIGFVVFDSTTTATEIFPRRLIEQWSNPVVGAVRAAREGLMVRLVVAVDGFGEIYTRSGDHSFDPGAPRRYAPRKLTEREWKRVEEANQLRRAEARRRQEEGR
jgi:hypothetical protein